MTEAFATRAGGTHARTALFLGLAMTAVVGTALGFEHFGNYIPCKLCLEQRIPYYVGIPLMAVAFLWSSLGWAPLVTRILLFAGGLLMSWGLYLGIYHAGVEWNWWAGPTDCGSVGGAVDTGGKGVLDAIDRFVPPACDTAALRVLGLSFAGWNVLASLILAGIAFRGAMARH